MRNRGRITRLISLTLVVLFCLSGCREKPVLQTEAQTIESSAIVPISISGSSIKNEFISKPAKILEGDVGKYLDAIDSTAIPEIIESTTEKYAYIGETANGFGIVESSQEEIEKMYENGASEVIKKQGSGYQVESMAQMEADAIAVLKEISCNNESVPNTSVTYSGNNKFISTAFGDHIGMSSKVKGGASSGIYDTKGHFEEAGLSLEMSNFQVEKVIGGESSARLGIITIVVSTDTKCVKNDGIYNDLEWIPSIGESQNIQFAITFWADCYNGFLHEIIMEDISIAN